MTHGKRFMAAFLSIGLVGAALPAAAQEEQSLQRHLERMIDDARQKLHNGLDGFSDELMEALESFADEHGDITITDENGNIIIERHWRRDMPKPVNPFENYEEPFGGFET